MRWTTLIITILSILVLLLSGLSLGLKATNNSLEIENESLLKGKNKYLKLYSDVRRFNTDLLKYNKELEEENKKLKTEISSWRKIENVKLTAYCPCTECSGQWGKKTKMGTTAVEGRTIAVDPKVIPLGSEVLIEGKIYIAEDIGGAVKGNVIDIYFDEHKSNFRKYVDVLVRI